MSFKIQLITASGQKYEALVEGESAIIGRSIKCDVSVSDSALSRMHCKVELVEGKFFVTDLNSANGVFIDYGKLPPDLRTHYETFYHLSFGTVDCTLEDCNSATTEYSSPPVKERKDSKESGDKTVFKQIRTKRAGPPPKKREVPQRRSINLGLLAPILIMVFAGYYYLKIRRDIEETPIREVAKEKPKVPDPPPKIAKDDFKMDGYYLHIKDQVKCEKYCKCLKLDFALHEGIVQEDSEIFVFMNPSRWLEQEQYLRFKENPDALELMAFYHLLPSKLLDDFFMKKMNHIHVLFFDNDGKILRVYRFHPSHFNPDKTPRMELITTLTDSMKTGTTQPFMDKIDPFLVKKIFQN